MPVLLELHFDFENNKLRSYSTNIKGIRREGSVNTKSEIYKFKYEGNNLRGFKNKFVAYLKNDLPRKGKRFSCVIVKSKKFNCNPLIIDGHELNAPRKGQFVIVTQQIAYKILGAKFKFKRSSIK